jgi:competence protein ComEA
MASDKSTNRPFSIAGAPLRPTDQRTIAALVCLTLVATAGYWICQGGPRGQLIDIDQAPPLTLQFRVDINQASWPELAQIPGIGETLARRIVESRREDGRFERPQDLQRIRGLGPKLLERMEPYLLPIEE